MVIEDNPEFDGTDAAHPAWWRGHDAGCKGMLKLKERLENKIRELEKIAEEHRHVLAAARFLYPDSVGNAALNIISDAEETGFVMVNDNDFYKPLVSHEVAQRIGREVREDFQKALKETQEYAKRLDETYDRKR